MKLRYVYRVDFADGYFYIGSRLTNRDPDADFLVKYKTGSKIVKAKMEEVPFTGKITHRGLEEKVGYDLEQQIIAQHIDDPMCLNKAAYYGREGYGVFSEETKSKMSMKAKERWSDPAYREMMLEKRKNAWTPERKAAQVERLKGKKRPEHSAKMKGRTLSAEQRAKVGRYERDAEHRRKMSEAVKNALTSLS